VPIEQRGSDSDDSQGLHMPGVYGSVLRQACRADVVRCGDFRYVTLWDDKERIAAAEREIDTLTSERPKTPSELRLSWCPRQDSNLPSERA
jgi:hypothetical protein